MRRTYTCTKISAWSYFADGKTNLEFLLVHLYVYFLFVEINIHFPHAGNLHLHKNFRLVLLCPWQNKFTISPFITTTFFFSCRNISTRSHFADWKIISLFHFISSSFSFSPPTIVPSLSL